MSKKCASKNERNFPAETRDADQVEKQICFSCFLFKLMTSWMGIFKMYLHLKLDRPQAEQTKKKNWKS